MLNLNDKAVQKRLATQWGYVDHIARLEQQLAEAMWGYGEAKRELEALHAKKYAGDIECQRCGKIIA